MRYGILGDIHSNRRALDAVLQRLHAERVDRVLCVGDIVGYGAEPAECIALVRDLSPTIVAGNHDWAVGDRLSLEFFNQPAAIAIEWTRRRLSREDCQWLASLPVSVVDGQVTLCHGTVHHPEVFDYLQTPYDAFLSFEALATRRAFVGHSHVPITFFEGTPLLYTVEESVTLDGRRTISNVGSVGQPRDEDPRASFGVFDDEASVLTIHRVPYDIDGAAASILAEGLPAILAERLRVGR